MGTLAASMPTAAISLYFREGSSDKVYHAQVVPNGETPSISSMAVEVPPCRPEPRPPFRSPSPKPDIR
jgi:hypothetical protein